jgi:hypothetical protein
MVLPRVDQDHLAGAQPVSHAIHPENGGSAAAMKDDLMFAVHVADQPADHPGKQDPPRGPLQDDRIARVRIPCIHFEWP